MKRKCLLILLMIACINGAALAQDTTPTERFLVTVDFESVYVRVAPSLEAEPAASVFQNNILEAVGRNLDGTWFEVRRPGRLNNLGWIFNEMVEWDFAPEHLPLTDLTTGAVGALSLAADPGFAVYINENVVMRSLPYFMGERLPSVPAGATVPVLARDSTGEWLKVHYLGDEGWIIAFTTRPLPDVLALPVAPGLPPAPASNVLIIPPELQLAQVQRMRDFVIPLRGYADGMAGFWEQVNRGEVMPCDAPAFVAQYHYDNPDIRQLPELERYAPRMNEGVTYLNDAITPLQTCGLVGQRDVIRARNRAINARIIFDATLEVLDNLEANVIN